MSDDEFKLHVNRQLEAIRRCQDEIRAFQDRLLRVWTAVMGLLVLLALAVLVLALVPGQQLTL